MAASLQTENQDVIECSICLELMIDPRCLQCQHSFCHACLEPLAVNWTIKCPKCRRSTPVPAGGLQLLPQDFTINTLTAAFSKTTSCDKALVCAACPGKQALGSKPAWFCLNCNDSLCQPCTDAHKKTQLFKHHELTRIINNDKVFDKCAQHPRKDRCYVCRECRILTCGACVMSEHQEHHVEDARKQLITHQQDLQKILNLTDGGYSKAVADTLENIDILSIKSIVGERFTQIQKSIKESANQNMLLIKLEQEKLEALLAHDKKMFANWVVSVKEAKSLISKIEELRASCGKQIDYIPASDKDDLQMLSSEITATIDRLAHNKDRLASFSSLEIPIDFIAASPQVTLGTFSKTSEIHPGLNFSMFTMQSLKTNQNTSEPQVAMEDASGLRNESAAGINSTDDTLDEGALFVGYGMVVAECDIDSDESTGDVQYTNLQCDECSQPIVGTHYKCNECFDCKLCFSCMAQSWHTLYHGVHAIHPNEHSSPPDAAQTDSEGLHPGVWCAVCKAPVVGIRYKCYNCPGYDLCSSCKAHNHHNQHNFICILPSIHSSAPEAANDVSDAMHPGVTCDVCRVLVVGIRYKCSVCPYYDLCSTCKASNHHNQHRMASIPRPVFRFKVTAITDGHPGRPWRVAFHSDVTSNMHAVRDALADMIWHICHFEDGGSIAGPGYNFELQYKDGRRLPHKLYVTNY